MTEIVPKFLLETNVGVKGQKPTHFMLISIQRPRGKAWVIGGWYRLLKSSELQEFSPIDLTEARPVRAQVQMLEAIRRQLAIVLECNPSEVVFSTNKWKDVSYKP